MANERGNAYGMAKELVVNSGQLPEVVNIQPMIRVIRDRQVMLDSDLSALYGVETRRLNEQVRRNLERFPSDFMFQLSKDELDDLMSQNATSSWGGTRKLPTNASMKYSSVWMPVFLRCRQNDILHTDSVRIFSSHQSFWSPWKNSPQS